MERTPGKSIGPMDFVSHDNRATIDRSAAAFIKMKALNWKYKDLRKQDVKLGPATEMDHLWGVCNHYLDRLDEGLLSKVNIKQLEHVRSEIYYLHMAVKKGAVQNRLNVRLKEEMAQINAHGDQASAMAVRARGDQAEQVLVTVVVPEGATPGDSVSGVTATGKTFKARVPAVAKAGDSFVVLLRVPPPKASVGTQMSTQASPKRAGSGRFKTAAFAARAFTKGSGGDSKATAVAPGASVGTSPGPFVNAADARAAAAAAGGHAGPSNTQDEAEEPEELDEGAAADAAIRGLAKTHGYNQAELRSMHEKFRTFDCNGDGGIQMYELRQVGV
jgi:hypothetical protein